MSDKITEGPRVLQLCQESDLEDDEPPVRAVLWPFDHYYDVVLFFNDDGTVTWRPQDHE